MTTDDDQLLSLLRSHDLGPEHIFIAGEVLYVSKHAGDFRASSTYKRLPLPLLEQEHRLLSLAQRLALPEYSSTTTVDAEISQFKDWETLYEKIMRVLEKHGNHDPFGDGDFFLIDDYYCSTQHKVECSSAAVFTPKLVADVQSELLAFAETWEVIFVFSSLEGTDRAVSVYKHRTEPSEA